MAFCPQCGSEYQVAARFCGQCGTSLPLAVPGAEGDPWVGLTVDRRYRVLARIGSGGMGLVYKVEHLQLSKVAAMKVLHSETARDAEAVRRFRTEAQAVSRLDHPNIVQTFDFGQWNDALYLVMEYLKGDDLAAIVKRDGPLPFPRAARLFVQICSALTDAHEAGVIHRDLKPENIVVIPRRDGTETAKVLDFGLAKLRERTDSSNVTSGNQVIGTPYYMSPEQVRSEPLDVRTDIYSLGATLYRVLTGTPPFDATTPVGVLTKHVTDPLEPPRVRAPKLGLPSVADAIVARAMAKARTERYATASDVQMDLEAALAGVNDTVATAPAPGPGTATTVDRSSTRAPTVAVREPTPPRARRSSRGGAILAKMSRGNTSRAHTSRDDDDDDDDSLLGADAASSVDRLRRQEFDAFERGLKRRRVVGLIVVPLVILLAAVGVGLGLYRSHEKLSTVEREPNDSPARATLIASDAQVEGRIGKQLVEGAPDMDYFRIPFSKSPRAVSARLGGIPGVDLVLELFDAQGTAIAKCDSRGAGGGEWLQPTRVGPGEAFLLVRQLWTQGAPIVEDLPDPYKLEVHYTAPQDGWEIEPNDSPPTATPLKPPARRVRGYLGSADDRDWFAVSSLGPGSYVATVTAPPGVDVVIFWADAVVGDVPAPKIAKRVGAGEHEETKFQITAGVPAFLGVARRSEADVRPAKGGRSATKDGLKDAKDPKEMGIVGLDDPYEIAIEAVRE